MPLNIIRSDITKMRVDAIVNAANTDLRMGGGVCGAIFSAAGAEKLQAACDALSPVHTGEAVITSGFALQAKYIIHTAGPVYRDGKQGEEALLRACYMNALDLARKHDCESVAFPLISGGIYGYPKDGALSVATSAIGDWLQDNDMDVSLVVFDKAAFSPPRGLLGEVKEFAAKNYVDAREAEHLHRQAEIHFEALEEDPARGSKPQADACKPGKKTGAHESRAAARIAASMPIPSVRRKIGLDNIIGRRLDEPFSVTLMRLIHAKGRTDVEVYKRANIDRKLFSKIRTGDGYMPGKKTAVALAIALELSLDETNDLLERAGFTLSHSMMFDVIVEYFITRGKYDIYEINNMLFEYDQPILGE